MKGELRMNCPKYTIVDAFQQVMPARIGSLNPRRISLSYLIELRAQILSWLAMVEEALAQEGGKDAKRPPLLPIEKKLVKMLEEASHDN
jgi:hypothetical protein